MKPTRPTTWYARIRSLVYVNLIQPVVQSYAPLGQVAWGTSIGFLVGLTPTVGVQMYIVTLFWLIARYGLRLKFNLPIAVAIVWISNPVTFIPLYFGFLSIGDKILLALGYTVTPMSLEAFTSAVHNFGHQPGMNWLEWAYYATLVLLVEFGWPMLVGSLAVAVPISLLSFPFTYMVLGKYRRYLAATEGISYQAWRQKYETPPPGQPAGAQRPPSPDSAPDQADRSG